MAHNRGTKRPALAATMLTHLTSNRKTLSSEWRASTCSRSRTSAVRECRTCQTPLRGTVLLLTLCIRRRAVLPLRGDTSHPRKHFGTIARQERKRITNLPLRRTRGRRAAQGTQISLTLNRAIRTSRRRLQQQQHNSNGSSALPARKWSSSKSWAIMFASRGGLCARSRWTSTGARGALGCA